MQKHKTLSNHAFLGYVVIAGKKFVDSLPENYRTLLRDAAKESAVFERNLVKEREKGYLETIKKAGVQVYELSPEERTAFRKAVEPVYEWFVKNVPEGKTYLEMTRAK